jgi:hypothetical protein
MPKRSKSSYYRSAFVVMYGQWIQIDEIEDSEELITSFPNPEKALLKKESFESLSDEAKEIIEVVIFNCPKEAFDFLYVPKAGRMTKSRIRRYFQAIWRSKFFAEKAVEEITRWVNQL